MCKNITTRKMVKFNIQLNHGIMFLIEMTMETYSEEIADL